MVQARGSLRVVDDAAWLRQFVSRLTDRHEEPRAVPWGIDDAPAEFIDRQLLAIVGIEIEVAALTGKWKVSQNRPPADRAGVIDALRNLPADEGTRLADEVASPGGGV
jgi:transcriptional regulator